MMEKTTKIAYLAEGKVYLSGSPDAPGELVESPFAQGILDRVERNRERNDWKSQSLGWNLTGGRMMGMPGLGNAPAEVRRIRFTSVASAGDGLLLYSLDTDHVGGLFRRDLEKDHEQRLLHKQQFRASDIARRVSDGTLAMSLMREDGTCHLAIMNPEGRGLKEVTEGDAVDQSPSWSSDGQSLLFQSAGIGRNAQGFRASISPYAIHRLDLSAQKVSTVLETDDHDLLMPKEAGGSLYYIRRPYQPGGEPISIWKAALDIILFPFRVIRAIVYLLNFISLMFARKPLITAAGPPKEAPDHRYMMIWGKVIDAERALKQGRDRYSALVPKEWQLVCRAADGKEDVIADRVLAYDVADNGSITYTDGSRIFVRSPRETEWREQARGRLIERVAIVE